MSELPRHLVMKELRRRILSGLFADGTRLPTELELAGEFRVSRGTIRSALAELAATGMIECRRGIGNFVRFPQNSDAGEGGSICCIFPESDDGIDSELIRGMAEAAADRSREFSLLSYSRDPEKIADMVMSLRRRKSPGVVVIPAIQPDYYDINNRLLDIIESGGLRYVTVDSPIARHGVVRGDFVDADGYTGMRNLVRYLAASGHRRIASVRVFAGIYSSDHRIRGVFDQLDAEKLPLLPELHRVVDNVSLAQQARRQVSELLELRERPDAIIFSCDQLALNGWIVLREHGIRIPEEISICGFDDIPLAETLDLTTVRTPRREIGRRAIGILLENSPVRRQESLPCEPVFRGSSKRNQRNVQPTADYSKNNKRKGTRP